MKTKVDNKSNEITSILVQYFGKKVNLSRIKFIGMFLCALCKVQTVGFDKLSAAFDTSSDRSSSLRRIQRFISGYVLDQDLIARFIVALLPVEPPYTLSMDRTNWKFGEANINALVLAVSYKGLAFPILFKLLPKQGNSNTAERIAILERFISLFGREKLGCLVADREFVGENWLKWLNDNHLEYHIRIRDNFFVLNPRTGKQIKASWLFNNVLIGEIRVLNHIYYVNDQLCYLSASKIKNKEGKPELQVLVSFNKPENAHKIYKERWQIETAFKALKSSGFNIEDTHLTDIERIEKLFALVIMAFTWAYKIGIYIDENIKPIRVLNNGKRAKSLFKYGLQYISTCLLNAYYKDVINIFHFLSCT